MERTVFEFRPLPDFFRGEVRRYAGGAWIPDDGEYDLAFIGIHRDWYPCCLYFNAPGQKNIVCSWLTTSWTSTIHGHPGGNPWHYALRDGATEWGGPLEDYYTNPNRKAGDSGMNKQASESGCSNGSHIEFKPDDQHIRAGLLRDAKTKRVFAWPDDMKCMYCGIRPILQAQTPRGGTP